MGHDPCKKILFNVVFLVVVAKRRRCSMLCVSAFVVWSVVCVAVCVCVCTHSQDHGIHVHIDVHVGVTLFAL